MRLFVVRIRRLGVDMDESIDQIGIEVAFALPDHQVIKYLAVPAGTTARQAVELSGIEAEFEAFALTTLPLVWTCQVIPVVHSPGTGIYS